MRRNKKDIRLFMLLLILLVVTIGYALISTTLKINGNATITKQTWSVYWGVPTVTEGSVSTTAPTRGADSGDPANTKLTWSATLNLPGDFYEFTVDAVNAGTIDAMITGITPTVSPALPTNPDYIKYSVTYADGVEPALNHLLPKADQSTTPSTPTTEKYKVRVYYDEEAATASSINGMNSSTTYTFTLNITYGQADDNAVEKPSDAYFATDSWDKIIAAYKGGALTQLTEDMNAGTTREVELDLDNNPSTEPTIAHLRIANLSTPSECSTTGFSQTACGFVIEFADIITEHIMNPYTDGTTDGDGNKGGWEHSEMRTYLNTDIYNALPSELSSKIKDDTTVVSGYGKNDTTNFTTTDKIYLFSTKEVWGKEGTSTVITKDTAEAETRQLDYYKAKGVTTSNYSGAKKKRIDNGYAYYWWLRSATSYSNSGFFAVSFDGSWTTGRSDKTHWVAPAFRIA